MNTEIKYCLDARTVTPHFPGIGRYVRNLVRYMPAHLDKEESLLVLVDPASRSQWQDGDLTRSSLEILPAPSSPFSIGQQFTLPLLLRSAETSLYHSPYYLMPYLPGIPAVLTVYDLIPLHFPHLSSARARLAFRSATALALKTARRAIAISRATQADFIKSFRLPAEKIRVIPLAADPCFRPQSREETGRIREKYNLPGAFVLYVGSNKPHKNLAALLEAWKKIIKFNSSMVMRLVVAGLRDERSPDPRQQAAALHLEDTVQFLGPIPEADLPGLYSAAAFFVFPSLYEGFGLPVLEALACGTPVACSDRSSMPEVAGDASLYFDPGHPDAIASAIQNLLEDPDLRLELRHKGFSRAAAFSWENTAGETVRLYRDVLGKTL